MKSASIRTICPFHDPVNLFLCHWSQINTSLRRVRVTSCVCLYLSKTGRQTGRRLGIFRRTATAGSLCLHPCTTGPSTPAGHRSGPATCSYAAAPRIPSHFSSVLRLRQACRSLCRAFRHTLPKKGPSSGISLDPFHLDSISHLFPARLCPRSTQLDLR